MNIADNIQIVKERILSAEKKSGREEGSVKLMAVSKFHPSQAVIAAVEAGQLLFGENRVQETVSKFPDILSSNPNVKVHLIGQLQSNKVKHIVQIADCIQSVDRLSLLQELEKQCAKIERNISVLLEYHTGEDSKSGFKTEADVDECLKSFSSGNFPHLIPAGFMTMAPFTDDEALVRRSFSSLRVLKEKMSAHYPNLPLKELSMGMSGDFELAIEEGSTLVRVGTAIFGERQY